MKEIRAKDINSAQKKAARQASTLNRVLGLPYYIIENGGLYEVAPNGEKRFVKAPRFGLKRVDKKRFKIKPSHGR